MASYRLYKDNKFVRIPAYLEQTDSYDYITAQPILRREIATYRPVWLLIPAKLDPESYDSVYGETIIRFSAPEGYRFDDGNPYNPTVRLETEYVGGRLYAYRDCIPDCDEYGRPTTGWKIRIRMAIEDREED